MVSGSPLPPPLTSAAASCYSSPMEIQNLQFDRRHSLPPPHPALQISTSFPLEPKLEHLACTDSSSSPSGGVPRPFESLNSPQIAPFLSKTYDIVSDPQLDPVISWMPAGDSFVVWDPAEFSRAVLPRNFKHNNFSSFVRQLNTYGFRKVHADRCVFANEDFLRGQRWMLKNICRRRSSHVQQIGTQAVSSAEEGELQNLRREKKLLMQEVLRLNEEHLMTVQQMNTLNQRIHSAEVGRKQMVSSLARLFQNHLKHKREEKEIASRVRRRFIRSQQQHSHGDSDFNTQQNVDGVEGEQLSHRLLPDMVVRHGIDDGGSNVPEARTHDPLFLDSDTAGDIQGHDSEYFVWSPKDITPNKSLPDALVRASERSVADSKPVIFKGKEKRMMNSEFDVMTSCSENHRMFLDSDDSQERMLLGTIIPPITEEEIWNMNFEAGGSSFRSGPDVWDDNDYYGAIGIDAGAGSIWDLDFEDTPICLASASMETTDLGAASKAGGPRQVWPIAGLKSH
uniref:Heat stress transcription factor A3B n=1 Tax=Lilium longiflorum TaxID=4690 RepID=A0A2L0E6W7_LILLO|nr:heat stress transcription factor A3B [Lilium longiflorum]